MGNARGRCSVGHASIREYALSQLEKGDHDGFVTSLFVLNYQQCDDERILSAIEPPDDEIERHSLFMSVIEVLEANPEAHAAELGIISYASTPCSLCRNKSVGVLLRQNAAPAWLAEECRFDAVTRIVESITDPPAVDS
jgi:hypothetical protein